MRAVVCNAYGPPEVLKAQNVPLPTAKDDEMLIKVHYSAVTASDIFIRSSKLPFPIIVMFRLFVGITKPRKNILGFVFAGVVEKAGKKITRFKEGEKVFGMTGYRFGAYAEYMCLGEKDSKVGCIATLPESIPFAEATSAVYGGSLALQYLEKGGLKKNMNVLVYGASGTTGTFAVQYAKHLNCHVTAVCSTANVDFMSSLGADEVIDYTKSDELKEGQVFDLVLDAVGHFKKSKLKEAAKKAVKKSGKFSSIDNGALILSSERIKNIAKLVEDGLKPVVSKTYPLSEIVQAHAFVEKGHKRGGVAVKVIE